MTSDGAVALWINLDRRPDRAERMRAQLADWPGPVERIAAVDGAALPERRTRVFARQLNPYNRPHAAAVLGCLVSHMSAVCRAVDRYGGRTVFVFEDDARLLTAPSALLAGVPDDWQLAILGGRPPSGEPDAGWSRPRRWFGTHAYAARDAAALLALARAWSTLGGPADWLWTLAFADVAVYAAWPERVIQEPGDRSDITGQPRAVTARLRSC